MDMDLQPMDNDATIKLPVTFDKKGGRQENRKTQFILGGVSTVFGLVLFLGTLSSEDGGIIKKFIVLGIIIAVYLAIMRFVVLRENFYSDAYETLKEYDFAPPSKTYWSIFEVTDTYPYIAHYKDGKYGIFVAFEKGIAVGKSDTVMYSHFDAIGDAYNLAGNYKGIKICHIDYMDNVGNDARMNALFHSLNDCQNPDYKQLLFDVYSNLQFQMSQDYASYDVYVFLGRGKEDTFGEDVYEIINAMMQSNYITYKILNIEGMRQVASTLLPLGDFSAVDACNSAFSSESYSGIKPIMLYKADGTQVKLNDTAEELRIKREKALEEEAEKRKEWKSKPLKEKLRIRFNFVIVILSLIVKGLRGILSLVFRKKKKHVVTEQSTEQVVNQVAGEENIINTEPQSDEGLDIFSEDTNSVEEDGDELDIF